MPLRRSGVRIAMAVLASATILAVGPPASHAQASACGSAPTRLPLFDEAWFAFPEAVAPVAGGHFITGTASTMVRVSADTQLLAIDTIMDGFIARGVLPPLAVKPVIEGRFMLHARLEPVHRDTLLALFQSSRERLWDNASTDSVELYTARYTASGWHGVRRVAALAPMVHFERGFSSDLVRYRGRFVVATVTWHPVSRKHVIALVNLFEGSSTVEYHDFNLLGATYVDLAVHEGTLWLAFTATRYEPRFKDVGGSWKASVWTARWTGDGWTPLHRAVDGTTRSLHRPRLISRADGLTLAWIEDTGLGSSLRWQGISPGADSSVHELPGVYLSDRGYPPFQHVITTTTMSDATVLVPKPGGMDLIARVPIRQGIPVLVGGTAQQPILLVVEEVSKPRINAELVAYSLKCGLPALLGRPAPR